MTDHSSNRLVHCTSCLLTVPLLAFENDLARLKRFPGLFVQVLLLQNDFRIGNLGVGNTDNQYKSSCIVRKVQALRDAPATDTHQNGASHVVIRIPRVDTGVISVNYELVLGCILWFLKHLLVLFDLLDCARPEPPIVQVIHYLVGGEKYENAAWCARCDFCNR